MIRKFRPNQRTAFRYTLHEQHPALFMEMRLGKTLVTIRRIKMYPCRNKVLIVCPLSAFYGWRKDLTLEGEKNIIELHGTEDERLDKLYRAMEFYLPGWFLMNKEGHRVLGDHVFKIDWDVVVLDENFIKDARTETSKFYVENFRDVEHRWLLTGTPAPEGEINYYQLLRWLDHSHWKEQSFWDWRTARFMVARYEWMTKTNDDYRYIARRLANHCFFQSRRDVKMGGKKIYEQRTVPMPKDLRRAYDKLEREYILEYPGMEQVTTWAPTKHLWLRRMCAGFMDEVFVSNFKIDELCDLLEGELREQQIVIWSIHTAELEQICRRFRKRKWKYELIYGKVKPKERERRMAAFQKGKIQYLVCQPKCFRYAVDLSAATTIVYYTSPEGYEERQQSEDRVIDVAHNDTVLVIDLVAQNTVEVQAIESLLLKEGKQEKMKRLYHAMTQRKHDALSAA